ncbi:MAG: CAAX amino terminal protease [Acidobacteria bacterium OLB17]|nr:MAG: CAAX amino terminal protease [Acidobacteria bacterium OLB17]MCZ2389603.1 CPBP family intramembrane metalloprotease [Acidobacteriota bacterium]
MQNAEEVEDEPLAVHPTPIHQDHTRPNDPPWSLPVGIGVWVLSVLAILLAPLFFVFPYYALKGVGIPAEPDKDPTVILLSLIAVVPAHLFTLLICYPVVTKGRRFPFFETLGWRLGNFRWWHFVLVIIGFFVLMSAISAVFPESDNELLRILRSSPTAAYAMAVLATLFAPFVEELVYRGVLYSAFERATGSIAAVLIVTFLFAGIHYPQYWGSSGSIIAITLLSFVLTAARSISGNLLPSVILHFVFNGLQSLSIVYFTMNGGLDAPAGGFFR